MAVDAEQLERALLNLLDNALACSPPGGTVEVRAWSADDRLSIEVQDMGPGIPDSVIQALSNDTPPGHAGRVRSGLGLPQVCRMAQMHGGTLAFTVHERGSTVHLTLPLAEAA